MSQLYKNIKNSASKDFISYSTQEELPLTGVTDGTMAYVESVKTLYIFDDTAWYGIRLRNDPPVLVSAPAETVIIERFTTYTFDFVAEDPDGLPLNYSYEVIEGATQGYTIQLLGPTLTITNSTTGTAAVIKFTISDGTNSISTTTRFVFDEQKGLQGDTIFYSSAINLDQGLGWFSVDNGLQYSENGELKLRYHTSTAAELIDATGSFSTPDGTDVPISRNVFIANGRLWIPTTGVLTERSLTNGSTTINSYTIDTRSSPTAFSDTNTNFDNTVVDNNIAYITGWDRGVPLGVDIYAVLIPSSGAPTVLGSSLRLNGVDLNPNAAMYSRAIQVSGDKVVLLNYSNSGHGVFYTFDKNSMTLLGRTAVPVAEFGNLINDDQATAMTQNYFFYIDRVNMQVRMFDISDPNNITRVTNLPTELTSLTDPGGLNIMGETLSVIHADGITIFDFDYLRGTISNPVFKDISIYNQSGFDKYPTVMVNNQLVVGSKNSSFTQVYTVFTNSPSPPVATNIPDTVTLSVGDTWTLDVDGSTSDDESITYSVNYIEGFQRGPFQTNADGVVGRFSFTPEYYFNYDFVARFSLSDPQGEITQYDTRFIVNDTSGPGSSVASYLANEAGKIFPSNKSTYRNYGRGLYVKDNTAFCMVEGGTIVVQNIDSGSSSSTWPTVTLHAGYVYYRNASEIFIFRPDGVYRLSSLTDTTYETASKVFDVATYNSENPGEAIGDLTSSPDYRGFFVDTGYIADYIVWWVTHEGYYISWDISDLDAWQGVGSGAWGSFNTLPDTVNHAAFNSTYILLTFNTAGSGSTFNPTFRIKNIAPLSGARYANEDWTHPDVVLPGNSTSELFKYAFTDDYLFIVSTDNALLASDGVTNARYTLFVYRLTERYWDDGTSIVPTTLVDTITFTKRVCDLKFKDSVLYVMFENATSYFLTYDWDWETETLTLSNNPARYVRSGIRGTIFVDEDSVYTLSGNDLGNTTAELTRFRGV